MVIEFPEIDEKEYAQLCFIKKYRQKGDTRYTFYGVNTSREVSDILKVWLLTNIEEIKKEIKNNTLIDEYNPSLNGNHKEIISLSNIDKWPLFIKNAFQISSTKIMDLKSIKRNLIGSIIYIKTGDYIVGQIRKMTPKAVLNTKGVYKVFFKNGTFNEIKEDIGLQVDDKADLIFFIHGPKISSGFIFNKDHFKSIFDMHEQEKKEAISRFNDLKILSESRYSSKIRDLIEHDRQIQKMLINPAIQGYMNSFTYNMLKELKEKVGDEVAYEIDEENNDFVLPEEKEKEALRDIIKAICGRYAKDLKGEHIIENTNVKRVVI